MDHDSNDDDFFLSSLNSTPGLAKTAQKRTASFAQLGDSGGIDTGSLESSYRMHIKSLAFVSEMEKSSLERKMLALESERKSLEVKLGMKDREIARLENDKRWLAEREMEERSEKEALRMETENERRETSTALSGLRSELAARIEEHAQLQQDFSALKRSTSQTINEQKIHLLSVTRQASQFEGEMKQLKKALEDRDEMISTLRSELDAKDTLVLPPEVSLGVDNYSQGWKIIQDELHRQASYIQKTDAENIRLKAEVVGLKNRFESIQVLREEKRQLENRLRSMDDLRHRVVELEGENDRLRGHLCTLSDVNYRTEMDGLLNDLESLRFKNVHLENSLGEIRAESIVLNNQLTECRVELANAQQQIKTNKVELEEVKAESQTFKRRVELAESETRFWKLAAQFDKGQQGPSRSENTIDTVTPEEARQLVEKLKQEYETLLSEISNLGGGIERHGRSWTDLSMSLNEETKKRIQAEEELSAVQTHCSTLLNRIEGLEQTLFELRGDIASGSHVPPNHRVLCLKENPFQQWVDTREEVVIRLKKENAALFSRLAALGADGNAEHVESESELSRDTNTSVSSSVPRESWEVEHAEKLALEADLKRMDKRLLRLQQIFKAKAQEFKDTISSILGYKFHFSGNGQVRLTSQYDLQTSFVFQSSSTTTEEGEGRVQLVGAGDSSLDDLPRTVAFWVEKRGSIPALMATVTLECFDKVWRARREEAGDEIF